MIKFYSGTPGSGKSIDAAREIAMVLRLGGLIFANFNIDFNAMKGLHKGTFYYINTFKMQPEYFIKYSKEHFKPRKEHQGLIIIDECELILNPKISNKERIKWINFFMKHRHYYYDIILICPSKIAIDKQIQCTIEEEYKHRSLKSYGIGGWLLSLIFGNCFFVNKVWFMCGISLGSDMFVYHKKYGRLYDSYKDFLEDDNGDSNIKENKVQKNDSSNKIVSDYITLLCSSSGHDSNDHSAGQS